MLSLPLSAGCLSCLIERREKRKKEFTTCNTESEILQRTLFSHHQQEVVLKCKEEITMLEVTFEPKMLS